MQNAYACPVQSDESEVTQHEVTAHAIVNGLSLAARTWHSASHDRNSCCGKRPQAHSQWQNLTATFLGNDVAARYLSQHVAKEETGLYKTRHCGAPAKVFSHWNDCNTDIDLILQVDTVAQNSGSKLTQADCGVLCRQQKPQWLRQSAKRLTMLHRTKAIDVAKTSLYLAGKSSQWRPNSLCKMF